MFHLNTEQLIDYWRTRRGADGIVRRSSIDPTHVLNLLPQVFMLGRLGPGAYRVRLAGDFVTELHDRDLRDHDFLRLWRADHRTALQMALEAMRRRGEPLVVTGEAHPRDGRAMSLEIALAPLTGSNGDVDRFIGLYQPTSAVAGLLGRPVDSLSIHEITAADASAEALPRLRLATVHGARVG